jgi:photosystem II stability/assembly factor-like uncharacterized protein
MRITTKYFVLAGWVLFSCQKTSEPSPQPAPLAPLSLDNLTEVASNIPPNTYTDLAFANATTGIAISHNGRIVRTTDAGSTWVEYPTAYSKHLEKVIFTDTEHGYIIGGDSDTGLLLKTQDAGLTWTKTGLTTHSSLTGIAFTNTTTGFVTGQNIFMKTTDGGISWKTIKSSPYRVYSGIAFKDNSYGIVTSGQGLYFRTKDGGMSWDSLKASTSLYLYDIYFTQDKTFIVEAASNFFETESNKLIAKPRALKKCIFLNNAQCIGVGSHYEGTGYFPYGDIFITNDMWATNATKSYTPSSAFDFDALAKVSDKKVMMISNGLGGNKILTLSY